MRQGRPRTLPRGFIRTDSGLWPARRARAREALQPAGKDLSGRFPLIVEAVAKLPSCIIGGEAVACEDGGLSSFDRIRHRRYDASVCDPGRSRTRMASRSVPGVSALYLAVRIVLTCLRSLLISPSRQGFQDGLGGQQGRPKHSTGGAHIHDLVLIGVGADHTSPPAGKCIRFAKMTLKSHSALALRT
jgi:hypothetical protein